MTKEELFEKYPIDNTHDVWEYIDSWMSVEIYRIMHEGKLPPKDDVSVGWVINFLDKSKKDISWWAENVMCRRDWESLFLTAKRMVYRFSDEILEEINNK